VVKILVEDLRKPFLLYRPLLAQQPGKPACWPGSPSLLCRRLGRVPGWGHDVELADVKARIVRLEALVQGSPGKSGGGAATRTCSCSASGEGTSTASRMLLPLWRKRGQPSPGWCSAWKVGGWGLDAQPHSDLSILHIGREPLSVANGSLLVGLASLG